MGSEMCIRDRSNILDSEPKLRSKKKLIEKFINENMPRLNKGADMKAEFSKFWTQERHLALDELCNMEGLEGDKIESMIEAYRFSGLEPLRDDILRSLKEKPKIKERKSVVERVKEKILHLIQVYDEDRGDI